MLSRRASALMGMPRGFWAMISSAWKACWAVDSTRPDPRRPSPPLVSSGTAAPFGGDRVRLAYRLAWLAARGRVVGQGPVAGRHGRPDAQDQPEHQVGDGGHGPADQGRGVGDQLVAGGLAGQGGIRTRPIRAVTARP